jgi:hypothetical protein
LAVILTKSMKKFVIAKISPIRLQILINRYRPKEQDGKDENSPNIVLPLEQVPRQSDKCADRI